jgi:hypothetical protein
MIVFFWPKRPAFSLRAIAFWFCAKPRAYSGQYDPLQIVLIVRQHGPAHFIRR